MKTLNQMIVAGRCLAVLAVIAIAIPAPTLQASVVYTLTDGNTVATIDPYSSAGMNYWSVTGPGGVNQLNQQWFWYRIGTGQQFSIDTISATPTVTSTVNTLTTTYANANLSISINYTLVGMGGGPAPSGQADITEGITIHSFGAVNPLNISFYQYSDFNLLGVPGGDTVTMDQGSAYQSKGATQIAESIVAPTASYFEANTTGWAGSTLNKLATMPGLNLSDATTATGDVTWAFQWDFSLAAGADATITKDKLLDIVIVPEPSVAALIAAGLGIHLLRRRSRK
jgi:hypothetical protein